VNLKGGSGGTCTRNTRQTRLVERALRERWRIPKAMRGTLIERLGRILDDAGSGPRQVTAAAKAILAASKISDGGLAGPGTEGRRSRAGGGALGLPRATGRIRSASAIDSLSAPRSRRPNHRSLFSGGGVPTQTDGR